MDALEAEFNREQVFTSPLHNIMGIKNILETIHEEVRQQTPSLRRAMNLVNAAAMQTHDRDREEYSGHS